MAHHPRRPLLELWIVLALTRVAEASSMGREPVSTWHRDQVSSIEPEVIFVSRVLVLPV